VLVISAGAWAQSGPRHTPVLLITVDTCGLIGWAVTDREPVRTPPWTRWLRTVRFENAYAQVPITLPSHAVILSDYPITTACGLHSAGIPPNVGLLARRFKRQGTRPQRSSVFYSPLGLRPRF